MQTLRVQFEQEMSFADPDASPRRLCERVLGERRAVQVPGGARLEATVLAESA